jgi:hypothetical protein
VAELKIIANFKGVNNTFPEELTPFFINAAFGSRDFVDQLPRGPRLRHLL